MGAALPTKLLYFGDSARYPKIQILSAHAPIDGKPVRMPQGMRTGLFAQAERERKVEGRQGRLG